jgi:hypothetical protein
MHCTVFKFQNKATNSNQNEVLISKDLIIIYLKKKKTAQSKRQTEAKKYRSTVNKFVYKQTSEIMTGSDVLMHGRTSLLLAERGVCVLWPGPVGGGGVVAVVGAAGGGHVTKVVTDLQRLVENRVCNDRF